MLSRNKKFDQDCKEICFWIKIGLGIWEILLGIQIEIMNIKNLVLNKNGLGI